MKTEIIRKYGVALVLGFFLGFVLLHPLSMVFVRVIHPGEKIYMYEFLNVFKFHHLPMAVYFGLLGSIMVLLNTFYIYSISKEKKRVEQLEGLLPICAYCKKIRDDTGRERGTGEWQNIGEYFSRKTAADFTHGICPECFKKVMEEDQER